PRILMSADPAVASSGGTHTVTFGATNDVVEVALASTTASANGGAIVDLTYRDDASNVKTLTLGDATTGVLNLTVDLRAGDDQITGEGLGQTLAVQGGAGNDTLTGPDAATEWDITGAGEGSAVDVTSFVGIENLTGGSQDDAFKFSGSGSITGTIDGKDGD